MISSQFHPQGTRFSRFMASGYGRLVRAGIGLAAIALILWLAPWPVSLAIALIGLVPLAAGIFNLCPVAPLWGGHFIGARYCGKPGSSRAE